MKSVTSGWRWLAGVFVAAGVSARAAEPLLSAGYGRGWEVNVPASAEVGGGVFGGALRKVGAGTLTLTNAVFTDGGLSVAQGDAVLTAGASYAAPERPARLLSDSNLLLWLDATTNVVEESGMAVRWHDVREADLNAPSYRYAERWGEEPGPMVESLPWLGAGASTFLNFGPMEENGRWMAIMRPNGDGTVTSNHSIGAQSFFAVRGTRSGLANANNYHGFFFGGWTGEGNNGTRDFHVGNSAAQTSQLWNGEAVPNLQRGVTSLDGRPISGVNVNPNDWFQLVGAHLYPHGGTVQFSTLFNDRNYHQPTTNFRQGGGQLSEVLVFQNTVAMSEAERADVEGYLLAKWINRAQGGTVQAEAGTCATLDAGAGETLTLGGVGGEGRIVKSGDGTLRLKKFAALPPRELALEGGEIAVGPLVTRDTLMLDVAAGGRRLTASAGVFVTAAEESGVLAKDGDGTWALSSVPPDVGTLRVEDGTLRIAPRRAATAAPAVSAAVPNADFEAWGSGEAWSRGATTVLAGWTFDGGRMMEGTGEVDYGSGVARRGSPWLDATIKTVDGGDAVGMIQRTGGCEVSVTLPEAGRYRLTFGHANRTSTASNRHLLEVSFDGVEVGRFEAASAAFLLRTALLPHRPAGTYTLRFQGIYLEVGDRTSLIDDIRITKLPGDDDGNIVPDGSFEETGALPGFLTAQTRYGEGADIVSAAGWTFTAPVTNELSNTGAGANRLEGVNVASSGVAEDTSGEWMLPPPDGARCAFIFAGGQVSIPLTFPKGGVYRLTFQGAGGGDNSKLSRNGWGGVPNALFPMDVRLDGVKALSLMLESPVFQPFDILLPPVTNNQTAVLSFDGTTAADRWTRIGLIDDVRVVYAGPVALDNPGFEDGAQGWAFMSVQDSGHPDVKSGIANAYGSWVNRIESGKQVAYLQQIATLSQTVTFPEAGTHTVSFLAAARSERGYIFTGHDFAVQWDGETVGTVTTEDYLFTRYTFRLPHVAAGAHTLTFQGISTRGVDCASVIDDVRLDRLAVEDADYAPFPPHLVVEVAEGARLSLDFDGVQPLHRLRIGGRQVSGLVSAATHPDAITGAGSLMLPALGMMIMVR